MSRPLFLFRLIAFSGLALVLLLQVAAVSAVPAQAANPNVSPSVAVSTTISEGEATRGNAGNSYLNKLFGNFGSSGNSATTQSSGPLEWFLIIFGTLVYGQIALLVVLWILFTADLLGIIVGLLLIGIILAFTLPRKPRPIALFVLACLNFVLGASIAVVVAFSDGVPAVLVSLVPLGVLVWLAVRQVQFRYSAALKS